MSFRKLVLVSLALGLCEVGETTSLRTARASSGQLRQAAPERAVRHARRARRAPARLQYITADGTALVPASFALAPAEPRAYSRLAIQFAAGLNAGYAATNGSQTGATRNAMAFSVMLEDRLSEHFFLSTELAYVQRGVQTNLMTVSQVTVAGDVQLNYLEVPLLLKTKFTIAPKMRVFFVGGPSVGLILNRQVEVLGLVNLGLGNRFNQVDFGIVAGTGLEYQVTPDCAVVGHLRSQFGLVNLDLTPGSSFYTRGIQLLLGVQFKL